MWASDTACVVVTLVADALIDSAFFPQASNNETKVKAGRTQQKRVLEDNEAAAKRPRKKPEVAQPWTPREQLDQNDVFVHVPFDR